MELFVSDLDGTLLDRAARLDADLRQRLNQLIRRGLQFTVASARSVHSMVKILDGLELRLPVIEFNGACVSELTTQQNLLCHGIEWEVAQRLNELAVSAGLAPNFSTLSDGQQRVHLTRKALNEGDLWYRRDREKAQDPRLRFTAEPRQLPDETIICITLIDREHRLRPVRDAACAQLGACVQTHLFENTYSPGWYWLTFHASRATKGHALEWLAKRHGVEMAEITVFGDDLNDLPMFEAAGKAIAVENAHPDLKRACTEQIGPHYEFSVIDYLERVASAT